MKKLKIFYVLLLLLLIAFLLPWYPTEVVWLTREPGAMTPAKFHKMLPNSAERYFIGSEPYSGLDILPFTIPYVMGFLLGLLALLPRRGSFGLALIASVLMISGVGIGMFCAPPIITTWTSSRYFYGSGEPGLDVGWWLALLTSIAFLLVTFFAYERGHPTGNHHQAQ